MSDLPFRHRRRGLGHGMNAVVRGSSRACQYEFAAVCQGSVTEYT